MNRTRATAIGFCAVLLWSLLAVLTVGAAPVPAFQLNAMCLAIGGAIGLAWIVWSGTGVAPLRGLGWRVWLLGVGGLFGYHFFYFTALRLAPPAEASLIAYLWPLLIVLFSGLLPGERLRWPHLAGALIAFAGAGLLVSQAGISVTGSSWLGYAAALICAFTWSGYSVLSRLVGHAPTASVAVFCIAASALSWAAHFALEQTTWPIGTIGWASVIGLGLGPVGLAFYLWDVGVKRGNIQLLGTASYAAPLLSTLVLIAVGTARPSVTLLIAAILITAGAALAALAGRGAQA